METQTVDIKEIKKIHAEGELEQLLELAEKVETNINNLKTKIFTFKVALCGISLLMIGCLVFLVPSALGLQAFNLTIFFITILACFICPVLLIKTYKKLRSTKYINKKEKETLKTLFNLIHTSKEIAFMNMTIISKTVIEMRLNRINFSG